MREGNDRNMFSSSFIVMMYFIECQVVNVTSMRELKIRNKCVLFLSDKSLIVLDRLMKFNV